jgi:GTP 3',8-cyclase
MAVAELPLADTLGRGVRDLRISVTDRCQFRCTYCMPREVFGRDFAFLPRAELLTFEELARIARVFAGLGVRKLRLTGGEPLLRRDLDKLVAMLAGIDGIGDIALTTNGALLAGKARALAAAGLRRVTVSLDSLDDSVFMALNDAGFPAGRVLDAIAAAAGAGLAPVKVNMVVRRGVNEQSILPMAAHFRGSGHVLRFIEYMDVGTTNGWRLDDVVPAAEIISLIGGQWPLEPAEPAYPGEVARRYRYLDGGGEIGLIASVSHTFCGACTRARLSADGKLYTCLFAGAGHDLRGPLRAGASDQDLRGLIAAIWARRTDRYSEMRTRLTARAQPVGPKVEMSHIGG